MMEKSKTRNPLPEPLYNIFPTFPSFPTLFIYTYGKIKLKSLVFIIYLYMYIYLHFMLEMLEKSPNPRRGAEFEFHHFKNLRWNSNIL